MKTKIQLVNRAYQAIRISGLTVNAVPEEISVAIDMLQDMMYEFESRNICTKYFFEDDQDENAKSGIDDAFNNAASMALAERVINFFGREVPTGISQQARGGIDNWSSRTAQVRQINPAARQPRGSGSTLRFSNWRRYYGVILDAPIDCETFNLKFKEVNYFTHDFSKYLHVGETIVSYKVAVSRGIELLDIQQDGNKFVMKCRGLYVGYSVIEIEITTSEGRVNPEAINFNINV